MRLFLLFTPTSDQGIKDQVQKLWMIVNSMTFAITMLESFTQVVDIIFPEPPRMFFELKKYIQKPDQTNF